MDWIDIQPVTTVGRESKIINRQIADLIKFRTLVDAGKASGRFFTADNAVNEALRRELVLRVDIARYYAAKKIENKDNATAIEAIRMLLHDRDGHRS